MKAAVINRTGTADEFTYTDLPEPKMNRQDICIRVSAAAVNPVDVKTRSGFLNVDLTFPAILGWDVSGTVEAVGESVSKFRVGDTIMGMVAQSARGRGTYSELVIAPESLFVLAPNGIPLVEAAAVPLATMTATQLLDKVSLAQGSRVLVTGAAGAVGRVVVQWLLQNGHEVACLARSYDRDDLTMLGATTVYSSILRIPRCAFDAVLDTAGIANTIAAVRDRGSFVSIADNQQPKPERGIFPSKSYVQEDSDKLKTIAEQVSNHSITVPVGNRYALSETASAHRDFEKGGLRGKVLLIP